MTDIDDANQQWYPQVAEDQQELVDKQERATVASVPVIQDVLDWFDRQIEATRGIELIDGLNPSSNAEAFKSAGLLTQGMHSEFKKKRMEFQTTFSRYLQEPADAA